MNPQRIAIKFFVSPDPTIHVDLEPFTPLFHDFIQKASVPGLLIDVADYAHVPNGPGIILIGNEVDYGLDSVGGHAGLLVVRKRYGSPSLADILRDTLAMGLHCVKAIEDDGRTGLSFSVDVVEVQIFDRLEAPNDPDAYAAASAESATVFEALYGEHTIERAGDDDVRKPLALIARAAGGSHASDAATLLGRL
jgi:hypothetical protein